MIQRFSKLTPESFINTCHRFGRFGPAYQVIGISQALENGDFLMHIYIFENNEKIEYPFSRIIEDPVEE